MIHPPTPRAPLAGVRIAVTRAAARNGSLGDALHNAGATVYDIPLTRIESLDRAPLTLAVSALSRYQWVVLTSVNAIEHLESAIQASDSAAIATAHLRTRKIAVVGAATGDAALERGWPVTLMPERFHADAMVDAMASRTDIEGARVLYPAAHGARDVLPEGLRALGAVVDVIPVYRSTVDLDGQFRIRELAVTNGLDLVTVAAPSAVDALLDALPAEWARRLPVACIGPVTARAARLAGFPVKVESGAATMEGLVRSIVAAFQSPG